MEGEVSDGFASLAADLLINRVGCADLIIEPSRKDGKFVAGEFGVVNYRDQSLHTFDFVPLAKGCCDRCFRAGLLELRDASANAFQRDPVGAADIIEERSPSPQLCELLLFVAGDDTGACSANGEHTGPAKCCALKRSDGVTHEACAFPRVDFAAELFLLVGCGFVEDARGRDGVMSEFIGEG